MPMEFNDPGFIGLIAIRFKQWLAAKLFGSTPLIYTSKGNIPIAGLQRFVKWEHTDHYHKFVEVYMTHDGEVVKESAAVEAIPGLPIGTQQASL
jgi:hypothetical protein